MSEPSSEKLARWGPSLLLVALAVVQLFLTHTTTLTPWKGAGFGMFTVVDGFYSRVWSIDAEGPQGEQFRVIAWPPGPLSSHLNPEQQAFPTTGTLESAADQALNLRYEPTSFPAASLWKNWGLASASAPQRIQDMAFAVPLAEPAPGAPQTGRPVVRVRIQMLRRSFSPESLQLRLAPFGEPVERQK